MSKTLLEKFVLSQFRYPQMVPLIVQRDTSANELPLIRKERYFVSQDMPLMQLKLMIQRHATSTKDGLFLFFGNSKFKRLENVGRMVATQTSKCETCTTSTAIQTDSCMSHIRIYQCSDSSGLGRRRRVAAFFVRLLRFRRAVRSSSGIFSIA